MIYHVAENTDLEVRVADDTVWLSQAQMAMLFGTQRQAITKHVKHIYEVHELEKIATSSILELVQKEGTRRSALRIKYRQTLAGTTPNIHLSQLKRWRRCMIGF